MPDGGLAIANSDPALLALLLELFSDAGYEVSTYITDDATHAAIRATQPRAIVLDAGLYGASPGWNLLKLLPLDPRTKHIPVLVTTVDHHFIEDKTAFLQALGYDVLELPTRMEDLLAKVAQLIARTDPQ